MRPRIPLLACTALALTLGMFAAREASAAAATNLLSNGDFEAVSDRKPADWPTPEGTSFQEEAGNHFLRVEAVPEKILTVYRRVYLDPSKVQACQLSFRYRVNELQRGKKNWHDGRIILDFKNSEGKKVSPKPPHPAFRGKTDGWKEKTISFLVPEDAQYLEVMPATFWAASGSYDIDDLVLTPTDPQPIIEAEEAAARKRAADIAARAAKVKPQVPPAPADKLPPMLHVEGNQIVDASGNAVWLQGVAIPSMEWSGAGENILRSTQVAIDDWNANVIRLGIREHFWDGTGPYQKDGGAYYRQLVDDVVNLAGANGVYVIIDLHRFRAPEQKHADFWTKVATKYKNHPAVMFELFNEPHDISWKVWRDGGFVSTEKRKTDAVAENSEKLRGFESIGMQAMIDAVRATGAKNIVMAGALDWAYDLSGVLNGYALDDRDGNGIVYVSHVYMWKSDWQGKFIEVGKKHPIIITECGAMDECPPFIPKERHTDPHTWVPDFLGLVQQNKYHWTGWSFHPKASPCLIQDWDYTPTPYWGAYAKDALNGKQFEVKKLR